MFYKPFFKILILSLITPQIYTAEPPQSPTNVVLQPGDTFTATTSITLASLTVGAAPSSAALPTDENIAPPAPPISESDAPAEGELGGTSTFVPTTTPVTVAGGNNGNPSATGAVGAGVPSGGAAPTALDGGGGGDVHNPFFGALRQVITHTEQRRFKPIVEKHDALKLQMNRKDGEVDADLLSRWRDCMPELHKASYQFVLPGRAFPTPQSETPNAHLNWIRSIYGDLRGDQTSGSDHFNLSHFIQDPNGHEWQILKILNGFNDEDLHDIYISYVIGILDFFGDSATMIAYQFSENAMQEFSSDDMDGRNDFKRLMIFLLQSTADNTDAKQKLLNIFQIITFEHGVRNPTRLLYDLITDFYTVPLLQKWAVDIYAAPPENPTEEAIIDDETGDTGPPASGGDVLAPSDEDAGPTTSNNGSETGSVFNLTTGNSVGAPVYLGDAPSESGPTPPSSPIVLGDMEQGGHIHISYPQTTGTTDLFNVLSGTESSDTSAAAGLVSFDNNPTIGAAAPIVINWGASTAPEETQPLLNGAVVRTFEDTGVDLRQLGLLGTHTTGAALVAPSGNTTGTPMMRQLTPISIATAAGLMADTDTPLSGATPAITVFSSAQTPQTVSGAAGEELLRAASPTQISTGTGSAIVPPSGLPPIHNLPTHAILAPPLPTHVGDGLPVPAGHPSTEGAAAPLLMSTATNHDDVESADFPVPAPPALAGTNTGSEAVGELNSSSLAGDPDDEVSLTIDQMVAQGKIQSFFNLIKHSSDAKNSFTLMHMQKNLAIVASYFEHLNPDQRAQIMTQITGGGETCADAAILAYGNIMTSIRLAQLSNPKETLLKIGLNNWKLLKMREVLGRELFMRAPEPTPSSGVAPSEAPVNTSATEPSGVSGDVEAEEVAEGPSASAAGGTSTMSAAEISAAAAADAEDRAEEEALETYLFTVLQLKKPFGLFSDIVGMKYAGIAKGHPISKILKSLFEGLNHEAFLDYMAQWPEWQSYLSRQDDDTMPDITEDGGLEAFNTYARAKALDAAHISGLITSRVDYEIAPYLLGA